MAELGLPAAYARVVGSRVRAQLSYRSSFAVNVANAFALGLLEFSEIYVLLANAPTLGGLTFAQAALVFALATLGFSLADLVFGQVDQVPAYIREGTLEAFLVRPMPVLAQMITADFQLRRAGRTVFALLVLAVVLVRLDLPVTGRTIYLLVATPLVGMAIYAALFVVAGGVQFFLINGQEFTNSFVYGSAYAGQVPGSVLLLPVRVLFTFVVPATVTAYLPALLIMELPGPAWLPAALGWWAPLLAVWIWALAWFAWRSGLRRYTGAGG
ncbi:ABC transporter permease [uncultured Friedmanniella sp.]|uniref:ABC transporter permease n=1 Tax=uncultured Friedmanniella sp. TaxID=335381 RepID=UPI0035CB35EA